MRPMPIWMSANPLYCAMNEPHSATSPFESASPTIFICPVLMPWARAMSSLSPVALSATPYSVPRNRYTNTPTSAAMPAKIATDAHVPKSPCSRSGVHSVSARSSGMLALPMMRRLMEYNAICVRMPASRGLMFAHTCSPPVMMPASTPTTNDDSTAHAGLTPATIITALIAAPVVNEPSTVRSGKSSTRYVR